MDNLLFWLGIGAANVGKVMIEKAQRKLGEARFFYQHLVNPRNTTRGDPVGSGSPTERQT